MTTEEEEEKEEVVLAELDLSRGTVIQMSAVGLLGFVVALALLGGLFATVVGRPATFDFFHGVAWWNSALDVLVIATLATVVIVPHEWVHGLAFRRYGGDPRYGVGVAHFVLPYAYASSEGRFTRNEALVIILAPLVVLTAVGTPVMLATGWGWLALPLAANAAGAVADVWMALSLVAYPPHVLMEDHEDGVRIIGRPDDRAPELSVTAVVWEALAGAAVAAVGLLVVLGVGGPLVLGALGVESLTVGQPGTLTYVFSFVNRPDEIAVGVGPGVLVTGAALGLGFALFRTALGRSG